MKHCISFSLIISGVDNHSFLVLQISVIFTLFTQRNMSKAEVKPLATSGQLKEYNIIFHLHFLLAVVPALKCFVWASRVRVAANISDAIILKGVIDTLLQHCFI